MTFYVDSQLTGYAMSPQYFEVSCPLKEFMWHVDLFTSKTPQQLVCNEGSLAVSTAICNWHGQVVNMDLREQLSVLDWKKKHFEH